VGFTIADIQFTSYLLRLRAYPSCGTRSILNDVVLNKRVSITDHAALKDAKRSLSAMLSDFLNQYW
jgi:hypothetical protein